MTRPDRLAAAVLWAATFLIFAGLEGKGGVDEIEVEVIELEFHQTRLEGGFDRFNEGGGCGSCPEEYHRERGLSGIYRYPDDRQAAGGRP